MGLLDAPVILRNRPSKNLFDKEMVLENHFMDSGGNLTALAGFGVSDYIAVTVGVKYCGSDGASANGMRFTTYFDANKVLVAGGSSNQIGQFTVPAGVAFIRLTYTVGTTSGITHSRHTFQLEAANAPTYYVPFTGGLLSTLKVGAEQAKFLSQSVNLFDKRAATDGRYLDNNNNLQTNAGFGYSDYIPVMAGYTYVASDAVAVIIGAAAAGGIMRFTTYYDANKNWVSGGSVGSTSQIVPPAGVAFIRFSYVIATVNSFTSGRNSLQFERGSVATKYVPYAHKLNSDTASVLQMPTGPTWGLEFLKRWHTWKHAPDYLYSLVLNGDSYIAGNYFGQKLRTMLLAQGLPDGGPGWCSFAFGDGALASHSINPSQLQAVWTTGDWVTNTTASWGIEGTDTVSQGANKTITITAGRTFSNITLVYKKQAGGAGFTYRVNAGGETTVPTVNGTDAVGTVVIDTSGGGSAFTLTIKSLGAGVSLSGALGTVPVANNYCLQIHKCGLTGGTAARVANTALFAQSVAVLAPKGVLFMFGTNEINANIVPSMMKAYIQNQVNYYRSQDPLCDLIFCCPTQQQYGTEQLRNYTTADYAQMFFQLAQENQGAFIDFSQIFGNFSQAQIDNGFMHPDRVHPADRGGYLMASTLNKIMGK